MIIKKNRLKTFMDEYDAQIGTDVEWEEWDDTNNTIHIFGADIETAQEGRLYDALYKKYNVE